MTDQVDEIKAQYIKQLLAMQGDTPSKEFANQIGISEARLSYLRNGRWCGISMEWVMRCLVTAGGEL